MVGYISKQGNHSLIPRKGIFLLFIFGCLFSKTFAATGVDDLVEITSKLNEEKKQQDDILDRFVVGKYSSPAITHHWNELKPIRDRWQQRCEEARDDIVMKNRYTYTDLQTKKRKLSNANWQMGQEMGRLAKAIETAAKAEAAKQTTSIPAYRAPIKIITIKNAEPKDCAALVKIFLARSQEYERLVENELKKNQIEAGVIKDKKYATGEFKEHTFVAPILVDMSQTSPTVASSIETPSASTGSSSTSASTGSSSTSGSFLRRPPSAHFERGSTSLHFTPSRPRSHHFEVDPTRLRMTEPRRYQTTSEYRSSFGGSQGTSSLMNRLEADLEGITRRIGSPGLSIRTPSSSETTSTIVRRERVYDPTTGITSTTETTEVQSSDPSKNTRSSKYWSSKGDGSSTSNDANVEETAEILKKKKSFSEIASQENGKVNSKKAILISLPVLSFLVALIALLFIAVDKKKKNKKRNSKTIQNSAETLRTSSISDSYLRNL